MIYQISLQRTIALIMSFCVFFVRMHIAGVGDIISLCDDSFDDEVIYVGTVYLNVKKEEAKDECDTAVAATSSAPIKEEHPNEGTTTTVKRENDVKVEIKPENDD